MTFVLWMTGLPCSGKTTLARRLQQIVPNMAVLDGDELREWLSTKDFSREGRNEHNNKVAHLAKLLASHSVPVCVSLVSPYRENREMARKLILSNVNSVSHNRMTERLNFIEVYVKCPLEICEIRDVKGMYGKARRNEIHNFTGVNDPYESPEAPEVIIDTSNCTIEEATEVLLSYLDTNKIMPKESS